jgi:hypothetical protein
MARPYSRKSFLQQVSHDLLRRYLTGKGLAEQIPWGGDPVVVVDAVNRTLQRAPELLRSAIDGDFQEIGDLADDGATQVLVAEGLDRHHGEGAGVDLASVAAQARTALDFAFQVFLDHRDVFDVAHDLYRADCVSQTAWRRRFDLAGCRPDTSGTAASQLASRISQYYVAKEGRGGHCKVDHWKRADRLYWFAHPEDYGQAPLEYDDQHELAARPRRPVFDLVFMLWQQEGWLDLLAKGDKRTGFDLQRLFGEAILKVRLLDPETEPLTYVLDGLMDRDYPLPLEPEDGVETVRVKRLRLRVLGDIRRTVTLEADSPSDPRAVYGLLDDLLTNSRLGEEALQLTGVTMQLVFQRGKTGRQPKVSFSIGHPNSCSLNAGDPKHEIARKLLRRWGIDVSATASTSPTPRRRPLQRVADL